MLAVHVQILKSRPQLKAFRWCQSPLVARACLSAVAPLLRPDTSSHLRNVDNGAEIFLVGTAHVSKASSDEVQSILRAVRPQTVFVELDKGRAKKLMHEIQNKDEQGGLKARHLFAGLNLPQELLKQSLSGFYRSLKSMGMEPGAEFKTALVEAKRLNAEVVLGDQEQSVTLAKMTNALSFMDVFKLITGYGINLDAETQEALNTSDQGNPTATLEAMKSRRVVQLMTKALRDFNPKLAKALIDDRDEYMVQRLRVLDGRVVGVVGLGHLDGLERRWQQLGGQKLGS